MWLPSCTGVETQDPAGPGLTAASVGPGGSASGSDGTDGMTSDGSSDATSGTGATDSSGETAGTSSSTSGESTSSSTTGVPTAGGTSGVPTTGGGPTDPDPDWPEIPDNKYCAPVADWDPEWVALEEEILAIVNQERALGADCGSYGVFGPADPMIMEPHLRCAARVHSKDMNDRDFFSHTNPDGEGPLDRMNRAEYPYGSWGENIAAGNSTAEATMSQWMGSSGHCRNIMDPMFNILGVGYYPGQEWELWTQTFGRF